jgi:hypothetical protein
MEVTGQVHASAVLPYTHWIGGLVWPIVGVEAVAKRKNSFLASAENQSPVLQPAT